MDRPIISVALTNLGAYNSGELIFKWLDLPAVQEEIEKTFQEIMVSDDPRPDGTCWDEHFISDYMCELENVYIGPYEDLEELNAFAERVEALDNEQLNVLDAMLSYNNHLQEALELAESREYSICPGLETWEALAEHLIEERGQLLGVEFPEDVRPWLDYEALGRDLKFSGEYIKYHDDFLYRP